MIGRCLLLLLISCESLAQTYIGPNYQAMGSTGTALEGIYSLTANPAGLVGVERPTASVNHQHHFFSNDVTTQAALLGVPTHLGSFGLALNRFGLKAAYNDLKASFSFAKRLGPQLALGLSTSYHQLHIPSYINVSALSVDVGMQYRFPKGIMIGMQYTNVGKATYRQAVYGTIPAYVKAGISYPWPQVVVAAEMEYRLTHHALDGHFGVEYTIADLLSLRGGVSVNPLQQHAGFGLRWQHFILDAAATFHPRLGTTPQIGISYAF
ncbi:hypothetical protein [Parapedobacter indicus]|uniref:Outer membrane protein beta-barrel domain-containing protein n=1 Tax=Parapedobacter indicus TaxID=1477437 RepID=A0A1I3CG89_9SPHI|nr:hypothetical protein [Parapedobacter indicus]PPL04220.1 hypothetical protein CLV26_10121 [Parapedobacter indicus]SFH73091.1 hypothetical protein SAMN05444682_1018 [Parapedobacter indicus]